MKVDCKQAGIIAERLLAQKTKVNQMIEELDSIEREIRTLSEMEGVLRQIHQCREETEVHGRVMGQMAEGLSEIVQIYQTTERKIQDAYMQERILYPRQSVGINHVLCYQGLRDKVKITLEQEDMT